jgi:nicotinamide-nucleotide amidase
MKIHIITIGDEILIGQIINTNVAWMGEHVTLSGGEVIGNSTVGDTREGIERYLRLAMDEADVVLLSGGLGPTKDDITKNVLADFFETEMYFHEESYDRLCQMFERFGRAPLPSHKEQCYMPKSATILTNKRGTAPGMWFEKDGKVVVSMPGVPYEMKYLMEHEVMPALLKKFATLPSVYRTIQTAGTGESVIAERIGSVVDKLPANYKVAYLPNLGKVRVRIGAFGKDIDALRSDLDKRVAEVVALIPELVFGYDKQSLESVLGDVLNAKGLKLATAESCTGGYLGHRITSVSGSSAYYLGGVVSYANEVKIDKLGVPASDIEAHGAVSEEVVIAMAKGAVARFQTDIGIGISGIAGPGGGTEAKPVGTIWLAIANNKNAVSYKLQLGKDRLKNIEYTGNYALNKLRSFVLDNY